MRKLLSVLMAVSILLSLVSVALADDDQITLRFMWWGGDARHEATLAVIDKFVEAHPNVTIEAEFGGSDGYLEKLSTQLYSGTAPDLMQVGLGWMPDLVSKGDFFVDYSEYPDLIDVSGFDPVYLKQTGIYDGKLLGLPTGVASNVILVNTTISDALGLDIETPLTWDRLIELGKELTEVAPDKYLINADMPTLLTQVLRPRIMQLTGNPVIIDSENKISFTRDQLIEVLDMIKALYDNHVYQPAEDSAAFKNALNTNPKWINGDIVMSYCVSSTINPLIAANPEGTYDVIQVPLPDDRLNDGYMASAPQDMCISKNSEHIDLCLEFFDYFFNSDEAAVILKDVRSVPAVESARKICVEQGLIDPIVEKSVSISLSLNGINEMGLTTSAEVEAILLDTLENVAYGTRSTADIADETILLLNDLLANQ